ncbi:MAG: aspartate-semialdehyde dehydrogenase [Clostridiales bacterium]|nr:aspartate-semialdehyde dehydrogenase [Clostridiales bacterium]
MLYDIAVVGATGLVGNKMLQVLEERNFPINNLYLYASKKSAGKKIKFGGKDYTVIELCKQNIIDKKIDIAIFSAGGAVSKEFAPIFAQNHTIVIDNSSCWRMDENVPLVVPEVNGEAIKNHKNIIANPNCSTIQSVVPLKPLHDLYKIKRIVFSTYQAVSGAGRAGCLDLENGLKGLPPQKFSRPIFSNCIPHIDVFMEDGYTKEEQKMILETQKILNDQSLKITATTVRVPVMNGHSVSANIEFEKDFDLDELKEALRNFENIVVMDDPAHGVYPTPIDADGKDQVFVGRIRRDYSVKSGANLWIVADNIRKGAATNAVQIAEYIVKNNIKAV